MNMTIKNMPAYAAEYPYIVYTVSDDTAWFYGAYSTAEQADRVAAEISGGYTRNVSVS